MKHVIDFSKKSEKLIGYFDATGTIVKPFDGLKKPMFYYASIVPGDFDITALPAVEFVINTHNIPSVVHCLDQY